MPEMPSTWWLQAIQQFQLPQQTLETKSKERMQDENKGYTSSETDSAADL